MRKILIASNNNHKISEIKSILKPLDDLQLCSLNDLGITINVIEDGKTLEENALIKARKINSVTGIPTLADDTGLFVDELKGQPGVYSARYAGENATYEDNCVKLISCLKDVPDNNRTAEFISVICFYLNENEYYFFKGVCKGEIVKVISGNNGFGYDPLFKPAGLNKTYAELTDDEKNIVSHRALALQKFKTFINSFCFQ